MNRFCPVVVVALVWLAAGCAPASRQQPPQRLDGPSTQQSQQSQQSTHAVLAVARYVEPVRATCRPPIDWTAEPLKTTSMSEHQVWLSPSGATAYGVINVRHLLLPLASDERVLREFLSGMRNSEGAAELIEKRTDATLAGGLGGIRFVARGGKYTVHANLASSGRNAWIWYAGTLTGQPVREDELATAGTAREATVVGVQAGQ